MDSSTTRGSSPDDPDEEDDLGLLPNGNAEKNKYIDSVIEEALRGMLDKKRSNSSNVRATNDLGSECGIKGEGDISLSKSVIDHNFHFLTDHQYGYVEATPEEIRHSNEISVNDNNDSFFERSEDSDQGSDVLFTEGVLDDLNSRNDSVEELLSPDKCANVKNLKEDKTFVNNAKNKNLSQANSLKCYYESAVFDLVDDSRNDSQGTSLLPSENNNLTDAQIPVLINENEVEIPPYDADRPIPKLTPQINVGVVPPNHENNLNIDNQVSHVSEVSILSNKKQESFQTTKLKHGSSKTVANPTILNGFTDKSEYTSNEVNMRSRISSGNHFRIPRKGIKNLSNDDKIIPIGRPLNKKNIKNNTHNCSVFTVKTDIFVEEKKEGSPTNISTPPTMPILIEETQKPIKSIKAETSISPSDKNIGRKLTPTRSTATQLRLFQRSLIKELSSPPNNNKKPVRKYNRNSKPDKLLLSGIATTDNTGFPEKPNFTDDKNTIQLGECETQSGINSNAEIINFLSSKNKLNEDISKNVIKEDLSKKQLNNAIEKNIYSSVLETDTFDLLTDLDHEKTQTNLHDEAVHSLDPFIKTNEPTADILEVIPVASILDGGLKSDLLGEGPVSPLEDDGPLSILNFFDKDLNCSTESVEKIKLMDIIEEVGSKSNNKEVNYLISNLDVANYDKSKSEVVGNYSSVDNRQKMSPFSTTAPELKKYDENNLISDIEKIDQIIDRELALSDSESNNTSKTHDLNDDRAGGNVIENNLQQDSSHAKPELPKINVESEVTLDSFNNQLSCKNDGITKLEGSIDQSVQNKIDRKHSVQQNILGTDGNSIDTSMSNKDLKSNSSKPQEDGNNYLEDISDGDFEIDDFEDNKLPTWNKSTARNAPNNQKDTLPRTNVPNASKNQRNKKVFQQREVTRFRSSPNRKSLEDSSSFNTSFSANRNKNTYISSGFRKKTRIPEKRYDFNSRKPLQEGQINLKPLKVNSIGKKSPNSETSKTTSVVNKKSVASEQFDLIPNGRVSPSKTVAVDPSCRRHKNLIINIEENICKRMQEDKVNFSNSKTTISLSQLKDSDLRKKLPDSSFPLSKSNTVQKNRSEDNAILGDVTVTKEMELSPTVNKKQVVKSPQHNKMNELKAKKANLEKTVEKLMETHERKLENRNAVSESKNSDSVLGFSSKIETEIIHDNLDAQLEMELSSGKYNSISEQSKHMKFEYHKENASREKCVSDLSVTADENVTDSSKQETSSNVSLVVKAAGTGCLTNDLDVCKKKTAIEHQTTDRNSPAEQANVAEQEAALTDEIVKENIDENHKPVSAATKDNLVVPNNLDADTIEENKDSIKNLSGEIKKSVGSINDEKTLKTSPSDLEVHNDLEINKTISVGSLINTQNISLANNLSDLQKNENFKKLATDHIEPFVDFNNSDLLNRSSKLESQKQIIENVGDTNVIDVPEATETSKGTCIQNEIIKKSPNIVSSIPALSDNKNVTEKSYPEKPPCKDSPADETNIIVTDATETTNKTSINDENIEKSQRMQTRYYRNCINAIEKANDEKPLSIESVCGDTNVINVPNSAEETSMNNEITEKSKNVETIIPNLTDSENSPDANEQSHPDKPPSIENVSGDMNVTNVLEANISTKETSEQNEIIQKSPDVVSSIPTLSDDENVTEKSYPEKLPCNDSLGDETNIIVTGATETTKETSENLPSLEDVDNETNVTEATVITMETSINDENPEKSLNAEMIIPNLTDNKNSTDVTEKSHPEKPPSIESVIGDTNVINVPNSAEETSINNEITEKSKKVETITPNLADNVNSTDVTEQSHPEKPLSIESVSGNTTQYRDTQHNKGTNFINVPNSAEETSMNNEITEKSKNVETIIPNLADNVNSTDVSEQSHSDKPPCIESVSGDTNVVNVPNIAEETSINDEITEKSKNIETLIPDLTDIENNTDVTEKLRPEKPPSIENVSGDMNVTNVEANETTVGTSEQNELIETSSNVESFVQTLSDVENSINVTKKTNHEEHPSIESFGDDMKVNVNGSAEGKAALINNEITKKSYSVETTIPTPTVNENSNNVTEKAYPEKQPNIETSDDETNLIKVTDVSETTNEMTAPKSNEIAEKSSSVETIIPTPTDNQNITNFTNKLYPEKQPTLENFGIETNVINDIDATETSKESINNEITEGLNIKESFIPTVRGNENSIIAPEKSHPEKPPKIESVKDGINLFNVTESNPTNETSSINNEFTEKSQEVETLRENDYCTKVTEISPMLEIVRDSENDNIINKTNPENPPTIECVSDDTNVINVPEASDTVKETAMNNEKFENMPSVESESIILNPKENENSTNVTKISSPKLKTVSASGNSTITKKTNSENPPSMEIVGDQKIVINVPEATETTKETSEQNDTSDKSPDVVSFDPTLSENKNVTEKSYSEKPACKDSPSDETNIIVTNATETTKETSEQNETSEKSPDAVSFIPTLSDNKNVTEKSYPEKPACKDSLSDETNIIVTNAIEITKETSSLKNEIIEKSANAVTHSENENSVNVTEKSYPEKLQSTESLGDDTNLINVTEDASAHKKTAFINNEITETLATTEIASTVNNESTAKTPRLKTVSDNGNSTNIIKKINPENPPIIESIGEDTNVISDAKATKATIKTPINNEITEKSDGVDSVIPNLIENENSTNVTEKSYTEKTPSIEAVSNDINVPEATENTKKTYATQQNLNENSNQRQHSGNVNPSDCVNENSINASMIAGGNTGKLETLGSVSQFFSVAKLSGIEENVDPTINDDKEDINMVKSDIDNKHIIGMKRNTRGSQKHINIKRNHVKRKQLLDLEKRDGSINFKEGNPTEVINTQLIGSENVKRPDDSQPSLISSAGEDKVAEESAVDVSPSSSSTVLEKSESGTELNNLKSADGITLHHLADSSSKGTPRNVLENSIETNISDEKVVEDDLIVCSSAMANNNEVPNTLHLKNSNIGLEEKANVKVIVENVKENLDCTPLKDSGSVVVEVPLKNIDSSTDFSGFIKNNNTKFMDSSQQCGPQVNNHPDKFIQEFTNYIDSNKRRVDEQKENPSTSVRNENSAPCKDQADVGSDDFPETIEETENKTFPLPSYSIIDKPKSSGCTTDSVLSNNVGVNIGEYTKINTRSNKNKKDLLPAVDCHSQGKRDSVDNDELKAHSNLSTQVSKNSGTGNYPLISNDNANTTVDNQDCSSQSKAVNNIIIQDLLPAVDCHSQGKRDSVDNDELKAHSNLSTQVSKNSGTENYPLISNDNANTTVDNQDCSSQSKAVNNIIIQPISESTELQVTHINNSNTKKEFKSGSNLNKRASNTKNEKLCNNYTFINPVHSKAVQELTEKCIMKEVKILVKKINIVNTSSKINLTTDIESPDYKRKRKILGRDESIKRTSNTSMHEEERPTKVLLLNSPKLVDPSLVDKSKSTQGRINLRSKTAILREEETEDNTGKCTFPLLSRLNSFRSIYECMDENSVKKAFIPSNIYDLLKKDTCPPSKYSHLEIICTESVERNSRFKRRRRKSPLSETDDESDNRNPSPKRRLGRPPRRSSKRTRHDEAPNSVENYSNFNDPSFPRTNNDRSTEVNSQSEPSSIHERTVTSSTNLTTCKRLYEPEISNETVPKHLKVGGSVKETLLNVVRERLNQAAEPPEDEDDSDEDFMGFEHELPCGCSLESNTINQSCAVNCFIRRANFKLCYLNRTIKLGSKHFSCRRNERYRTFRPSRQETGKVEDDVKGNKSMQLPDEASASVKPFRDPGVCFVSLGIIRFKNEQSFNLEGSNYSGLDSSNNVKVPDNKRKRRIARLGTKPSSLTETDKNNEEDSDSSS